MKVSTSFGTVKVVMLKGEKGDKFEFEDYTPEELESLRGEKGDAFTYEDFTEAQLEDLRSEVASAYYRKVDTTYYTIGDNTETIPIPIEGYKESDMLFVDVEGLALTEGVDYTIDGNSIVLTEPITHHYTAVNFRALCAYAITAEDYELLKAEEAHRAYETVAAMLADENLTNGMIVRTLGFHSAGDGGAALYLISSTGTANGMDVLACENGLFAKLVVVGRCVTPEMFGAYGDDTHDDSAALQAAINFQNSSVSLINGKTYKCDTTITITSKFEFFDGHGAIIHYTGNENGLYINMSGTGSHRRDVSFVGNFTIKAPNSANAIYNNLAIKTRFENIRVYDFPHNGIYMAQGGYESFYGDIYLACRKISGTVGITGGFGDVEFGNLFGVNVETFMRGAPWGSNSIEKLHAWCFNGSPFDDEPSMSDSAYQAWFANTVLIDVTSATAANSWSTVFKYVNCDTYNTFLKWGSYWRNLVFDYVSMHATPNVIEKVSGFTSYPHYVLCNNLQCSDNNLNEITSSKAIEMICFKRINGYDYEYAHVISYTDSEDNEFNLQVFREPRWIRAKKPKETLTVSGLAIMAIIPFVRDVGLTTLDVKRPWNGTNGSAVLYPGDIGESATEFYMLAMSNGYIDSAIARLVKIEPFRE